MEEYASKGEYITELIGRLIIGIPLTILVLRWAWIIAKEDKEDENDQLD